MVGLNELAFPTQIMVSAKGYGIFSATLLVRFNYYSPGNTYFILITCYAYMYYVYITVKMELNRLRGISRNRQFNELLKTM